MWNKKTNFDWMLLQKKEKDMKVKIKMNNKAVNHIELESNSGYQPVKINTKSYVRIG